MKKLLVALVICLVPTFVMGAAPSNNSVSKTTASQTIDSQHTCTVWELIDSTIVVKDDTCDTYYHVCGTVILQPGERFYLAFKDGGAAMSNTKTFTYPGKPGMEAMTIYFGNTYVDSLRSQTDANDTIFVYGAVLGTTHEEEVTITSVRFTGTVINKD